MNKKEVKQEYATRKKAYREEYRTAKRELRSDYKENLSFAAAQRREQMEEVYATAPQKPKLNGPHLTVLEEIGNAVTHGLGSVFSVAALVFMLLHAQTTAERVAAIIYFCGLFILFLVSCLYHSFRYGTAVKRVFRRFDYSSIYLLIGATFAPILLCYVGGVLGLVFFIVQWSIIVTGITLVCVFSPARLRWLHFTLYFVIGWSGLVFLPSMIQNDLALLFWILGGGVVYSLGMIPFAMRVKSSHFIWHFFVLAGAVVQWIGIYQSIYLH